MDVVLLLLIFFYVGQSADVLIRKFMSDEKPWWLIIFPIAILASYFTNNSLFILTVIFTLMFWSGACRCFDYGITYAFFGVYVTAIVYGPLAAIFVGTLPLFITPLVRPDMQIIGSIITAFMLSISAAFIGAVAWASPGNVMYTGVAMLVIYNIVVSAFLFGRTGGPFKNIISALANIGINYYLMINYVPVVMGLVGG